MDYVTRQFINLAKKLRDDVRKHLSTIHGDLKEQSKATRDHAEATKGQQIPDHIIATFPHGIEVRKNTQDKYDEKKSENKSLRVQKGTMVVVAIYTGLAALQWVELIKATDAAEKSAQSSRQSAQSAQGALEQNRIQFRLDQRPYLWVSIRGGFQRKDAGFDIFHQEANSKIYASVVAEIRNAGRSPAAKVVTTKTIYIIGPAREARQRAEGFSPHFKGTEEIVMPGTGTGIAPYSETKEVSADDAAHILKDHTWKFYVVGAVRYADIFAPPQTIPYETRYCYEVSPEGLPFVNCDFGDTNFHSSMN